MITENQKYMFFYVDDIIVLHIRVKFKKTSLFTIR